MRPTRREAMEAGLLAMSVAALPRCACYGGTPPPPLPSRPPSVTPWPEANAILAATTVPTFAEAVFAVTDSGAVGDGSTDNTAAFTRTIAACHRAGGGRVLVPPGIWVVGALRLRSGVELHVERGATLMFSGNAELFPPVATRFEGIECVNRSPMIYAYDETNIALTGDGCLDASLTSAWNHGSDRAGILEPLVARGVAPSRRSVVGMLRTSFVQPYRCTNVLVRGVTLQGARFWQIHPVLCTNVTIDGVVTRVAGANTDACDPESCRRVVIRGCTFASGDDNIAVKSGRDDDGRRVATPCEDIVIMNCQGEGRFGFICLGSEQTGGIRNVYAYNNRTFGRGVGWMLWVKSNSRRGGFTENVRIDGFTGAGFRNAVVGITMTYAGQSGDPPRFDGLQFSRLDVRDAPMPFDIEALPSSPLGLLTVRDARFLNMASPTSRLINAPHIVTRDVLVNGATFAL